MEKTSESDLEVCVLNRIRSLSELTGKPLPENLRYSTLADIAELTVYFGYPIIEVLDSENNIW